MSRSTGDGAARKLQFLQLLLLRKNQRKPHEYKVIHMTVYHGSRIAQKFLRFTTDESILRRPTSKVPEKNTSIFTVCRRTTSDKFACQESGTTFAQAMDSKLDLKEALLNKTDELCERALLNELRSLSQFFECVKAQSSMVSREQEIATQEALDHIAHKNVPRAIRVLRQAVERESLNLKGHLLLGTIYMNLRSYPRAVKVLRKGREVCRQTIKYLLMHAELLEQDSNTQDGRDFVILLHRIADVRFYEGLFQYKLAESLIRVGAYNLAMRQLASGDADDQPTHGL